MAKRVLLTVTLALLVQLSTSAQDATADTHGSEQRIADLKRKAQAGDAKSQVDLGFALAVGDGVPADEGEAVEWFRKAAEQGNSAGEYALAEMYATGRGVATDYAEALKWMRKSAEQGDARGEYNLAAMYAQGKGVSKDDAEAAKWMRRAAEQGLAAGQFGLGTIYAHGRGVPRDEAEAVKWYRKAVDQGDLSAMNNLAFLLATSTDPHVRNPNDAIEIAQHAVDSNPKEPAFLDTLARSHYEAGQYEKAVEAENKALELSPDNAAYKDALQKYRGRIKK